MPYIGPRPLFLSWRLS